MISEIFLMFFLGAILVSLEILLPGGIIGFFGLVCFGFGTWKTYQIAGAEWAFASIFLSLVWCVVILWFEFWILPKLSWGKKIYLLTQQINPTTPNISPSSSSDTVALTPLVPSGYILWQGKKVEARCLDGFAQSGDRLKVVKCQNFTYLVKSIDF